MEKTSSLDLTREQITLLQRGLRLLDQGDARMAHECFEDALPITTGEVHTLFRALAQLGAAYYQLRLGRGRAARNTLAKACRKLALVDALSLEFQQRVVLLFETLGATEGCARFIDVPVSDVVQPWPVPDNLRPVSNDQEDA